MNWLPAFISIVAIVAASLVVSSCASDQNQAGKVATTEQSDAGASGQSVPASALAAAPGSEEYRISARDILDITVFQVPDLTKPAQVTEDGNISLPLVGKVKVGGKTTYEAEQALAELLRKKYLQSPQVTVFVKQYGQRITVNGEVKSARVLSLDGKVTLTQAIANAGGLSELANSERIHIARSNGTSVQDDVYNLDAIQAGKAPDPVLRGGDIIVAEQSGTRVAFKTVKDLLPFAIFANIF